MIIKCGLITGMDMIRNKQFYQLYRIADNEIIRTSTVKSEIDNFVKDHGIEIVTHICMLSGDTFTIKE